MPSVLTLPTATCPRCGKSITKGDPIGFIRGKRSNGYPCWLPVHPDCVTERPHREEKPAPKPVEKPVPPVEDKPKPKPKPRQKPQGAEAPHERKLRLLLEQRKNILLVGRAGCGKTYIARKAAEQHGLRFKFISCSAGMSEGQLLGRLLPVGDGGRFEYVRSDFVLCYEEGGVFLLDEIDAADANTLLVVNAALANGHLAVPSRPGKTVATRHPDFVCVAAANTFGNGADRQYAGRSQLDQSTLDRFRIGTVVMDYDTELERRLCPDEELLSTLWAWRERIAAHRCETTLSTRFIEDAYGMKQAGYTMTDIEEAFFAGWAPAERQKVLGR